MPDISPVAIEIARLIATGATQTELIAVVAHLADLFPEMTPAELWAALREATAEAERRALRPH
jgi:hypothetical protein